MPSVAVNPPKTPVTKGSNGMATATLPNVCKMPGPPPPFVPTPLPNIGMSGKNPQKYSTTVTIEGDPVAIQGATFDSTGDIASKATGGGLVSSNAEGITAFVAPGSLDVKIEGKDVQFLGDQMLNNCGPAGSPANSATMGGVLQAPGMKLSTDEQAVGDCLCSSFCDKLQSGFKKGPRGGWSKKGTHTRRHNWSYELEREMEGSSGAPAPACLGGHQVTFTEHFPGDPKTIPDATMRDASGAVCRCFDFKFPGDRFRGTQRMRQTKLAKGKKPVEISAKTCACN